jgi:hypothetical protein
MMHLGVSNITNKEDQLQIRSEQDDEQSAKNPFVEVEI